MLIGAVVAVVVAVAPALAGEQPTGWDGVNPFACELQQAGFAAMGPDPAADPYCVEFDKRRQNITELGIVDFLSLEPARVAAASDKCFYFQSDHWRSAFVQDDGATKIYEWDGHYFFDKARAEGGAWVTNFTINGHTGDPSTVPGMPEEYARYMGPGTAGVITRNDGEADPECLSRAKEHPEEIYAAVRAERGTAPDLACNPGSAQMTRRRLGAVALGDSEARVRELLGRPAAVRRGFLRFCADQAFRVGFRNDRSGDLGTASNAPAVMVWSRDRSFRRKGAGVGTSRRTLAARHRHLRRTGRAAGLRWVVVRRSVLFGLRGGRVRAVAVADRSRIRTRRGLRTFLRRAR